ncbi:MAG: hypothetical protein QW406_04480 [Ignisphaera sp.]
MPIELPASPGCIEGGDSQRWDPIIHPRDIIDWMEGVGFGHQSTS